MTTTLRGRHPDEVVERGSRWRLAVCPRCRGAGCGRCDGGAVEVANEEEGHDDEA